MKNNHPKVVSVKSKLDCSKRTKERIKQHGPDFEIRSIRSLELFNGHAATLLYSEKDNWFGWIPLSEIDCVSCVPQTEE